MNILNILAGKYNHNGLNFRLLITFLKNISKKNIYIQTVLIFLLDVQPRPFINRYSFQKLSCELKSIEYAIKKAKKR